jgi:hypothetical protein|nr:MAG TPA: hypothetical protein [Caudoviricetes sp.]
MPKLRSKKILAPEKEILAFPDHYVNLPGTITYANLKTMAVADDDFEGAKTLKKGTVVAFDEDGNVTAAAAGSSTAAATGNGIVFNTIKLDDFDETDVAINVAVLVHGFVRKDRLVGADNLDAKNTLIHVVNK